MSNWHLDGQVEIFQYTVSDADCCSNCRAFSTPRVVPPTDCYLAMRRHLQHDHGWGQATRDPLGKCKNHSRERRKASRRRKDRRA